MLLCEWDRQTGNDLPLSVGLNGHDLPPWCLRCARLRASNRVHRGSFSPPMDEVDVKLTASIAAS
jgi:hypothetical protein